MARILVVDDSPDVRLALATILEDAGYDVVEAENGDQVFDLAVKESPNLVLLDVMMPRVNGFDALATLKADTRTSPIPVIMVTTESERSRVITAIEAGVSDYLVLKQAKVESRIVIRVRAAAIGWQVSARALFEFCVAA